MAAKKKAVGAAFEVGKAYFIRTVTNHYTGRLVAQDEQHLKLEDAAWIADSGCRFGDFLAKGPQSQTEIEPFVEPVILLRGSLVDATPWPHALPRQAQ